MNKSTQLQINVKMKASKRLFGKLVAQEFELKSTTIKNNFLLWNESDLQPMPKNTNLLEWTDKDIPKTLTGLQRDATYKFNIRIITQMSSHSEGIRILETCLNPKIELMKL